MAGFKISEKLTALRAGKRWWPAEIVLRGIGLVFLAGAWRLALLAHRMARTPALHPAGPADLAICAAVVILLCGGMVLALVGPGLLLDVPLPPHFTRPTEARP